MFVISSDKTIHITRGDTAVIEIGCDGPDGNHYEFKTGDTVRFKVFERRNCDNVVLVKDVKVVKPTLTVDIELAESDTKIGDIINKPVNYWYEVELNPEQNPQTIIAYDAEGPKIFKLYPEGGERN